MSGATVVNTYDACTLTRDKIAVTAVLAAAGVPVPPSWAAGRAAALLPVVGEGPLWIKPQRGIKGVGMRRLGGPVDLAVREAPVDPYGLPLPLFAQQEVAAGSQVLKVYVVGDQLWSLMKPFPVCAPQDKIGTTVSLPPDRRTAALACGLLGQLLVQSGYTTLFVARRPEVIDAINRHRGYVLNVAGKTLNRLAIRHCRALSIHEKQRVAEAVVEADVVCTAVGIDNLTAITPAIAEGLWRRGDARGKDPLNVVACENLPGAGAYLRHQVVGAAPLEHAIAVENIGGFSAALTRRIMTGGAVECGELTFTVDAGYDLIVDVHGLKGALPEVQGATLAEEFPALVMRKLFTLNCAHVVAAYLGHREGCRYIHEAAAHPRVAPVLQGAVAEATAALKAEFPHQAADIDREAAEALERIANRLLADTVSRVARGPRRKLSPRERLVGPARLASQHHLPYEKLSMAIAAALTYDDPEDPQAAAMQRDIATEGVDKILTEDCGLLPHEDLALAVKQRWLSLVGGTAQGRGALAGPLDWASTSLEEIMENVTSGLSRHYEPEMVREVLDRVAQEFREARVWLYVPILMKKRASEELRGLGR